MEEETGKRVGFIRSVNPKTDLGAIADLIELCFKDTIDEDGLDYIRYLRKLAADNNNFYWSSGQIHQSISSIQGFIYEVDGRIVGNLSMIPFHKNGDFVYLIANVAVLPEYRRQRIAFDLTARGLKHAREKSARSVWLQVRDDNPAAINLYEQMGFVERCRRSTFTIKNRKLFSNPSRSGIKVQKRKDGEWKTQRKLLEEIYPDDVRWNLGLKERKFLPGFWQSVSRFLGGISITNLSVYKGKELLGFATLEKTSLFADNLWIVCPEINDDVVIRSAVTTFRSSIFNLRPQSINFPVDRGVNAFFELGFQKNHTLIWMEENMVLPGVSSN